ncbi:MAG: hypothetical protein SPI59_03670 [Finegoldia sp.]|nr:hypothetical protein [Finegoldia sp.]
MHAMLKKFVDDGFMTEEQEQVIEDAIANKESIIISGHRSTGIRQVLAAMMAIAKKSYDTVQVKDMSSLEKEGDYYMIPGIDSDEFEDIVLAAFSKPNSSIITIKEPEHPYSIIKIMKKGAKESGDYSQTVNFLEARKMDGVPFLISTTKMTYNDKKGIDKEKIERFKAF